MKGSFNLRITGILYFTFIILQSPNTNLVVTYSQESSADSLQNGSSQSMINHNMTQMMQRGNLAMGFDQTKITHEFSSIKGGGQIKITALDEKDNNTISQIKSPQEIYKMTLLKETLQNHSSFMQNQFLAQML